MTKIQNSKRLVCGIAPFSGHPGMVLFWSLNIGGLVKSPNSSCRT
jgi:hypothetical protein